MKLIIPDLDRAETICRYSSRYEKFGYSPKSLGWEKGKQDVRFDILTSHYDFSEKSVLDIGCGFGDLNKTLGKKFGGKYSYLGVDLVPDLIDEARKRYIGDHIDFTVDDFLSVDFSREFDFVIASGVFNHHYKNVNNYDVIEAAISKALSLASDGLAFDFLSDKVDYRLRNTFHSAPEKILSLAYKFSRNVILRNDYMPFEFSLFVFKDDSFSSEDTLFFRYKSTVI